MANPYRMETGVCLLAITLASNLKDFLHFSLENLSIVTIGAASNQASPGVSGTDFFRSIVEPILLKYFLWKLAKVLLHHVNMAPLPKSGFTYWLTLYYVDAAALIHHNDFGSVLSVSYTLYLG